MTSSSLSVLIWHSSCDSEYYPFLFSSFLLPMHHLCLTHFPMYSLSFRSSPLLFLHYYIFPFPPLSRSFTFCNLFHLSCAIPWVFPTEVNPTLTAKCTLKHSHILASLIYDTWQIKYLLACKTAYHEGSETPPGSRLHLCICHAVNYAPCCPEWVEVWHIKSTSFIWTYFDISTLTLYG